MTHHGVQLRPIGWRTPHLPVPPVIQQRPTVSAVPVNAFVENQKPKPGSIPLEVVLTKACEAAAVALGHNAREVSRYMQRSNAYVAKVIEQHKADAEQVKAVVEKVRGQA